MAYTNTQKDKIHEIVNKNIKEFVPVHETTFVAQMIINSTETNFDKVLISTNHYLDSVYKHPMTVMINPIFHNQVAIMNNELKAYLGK